MKKKLIIFDLDNTFYEYQSSHASALKTVYKNQEVCNSFDSFLLKYDESKERIHSTLKNNPSKHSKLLYFKDLFSDKLSFSEILDLEEVYWSSFIVNTKINFQGINTLKKFKNNNKYFLFTNQNTNIQLKKISRWNLDIFDLVMTSEEVGYEKPQPQFFEYVDVFVSELMKDNYELYSIGDDYQNDIHYWKEKYNSKNYLIDNTKSDIKIVKDVFCCNFDIAVSEVFK